MPSHHQFELLDRVHSLRGRPPPAPAAGGPPPEPDEVLRPGAEADSWRPEAFPAGDPAARLRLAARVVEEGLTVHDTLREQLVELLETREPALELGPEALSERMGAHLQGLPLAYHGTWFLYPWSRRVVRVLPEPEFRELRSSRNRNKISSEEQERLRAVRLGVVGLSVGSASAIALAMEQVGGELYLADHDRLSLSNLNRLRAGVHELGVPKAVLTARAIAELDPYLRVWPFLDGITDANMDRFLRPDGRPLDLLVEECDDLYVKVRVREAARALRIPVLMETSDRGLLDVERFDLEPERPILHGLVGALDAEELRGLDTSEKVPIVLRILGERSISPRLAASLVEVKATLKTWPQLASAVSLGAAVVTDTARRIALGELRSSGRFYVDLGELVRDGAGAVQPLLAEPVPAPAATLEEARAAPPAAAVAPAAVRAGAALDTQRIRALVELATLAPSGGNCQPWRFSWDGKRLRLLHDAARSRSFLDYRDLASWLAFGAAVENIALASAAMGLDMAVDLAPDPREPALVCDLRFAASRAPAPASVLSLAAAIPDRATNRKLGPRAPLAREARDLLLRAAADVSGAALHLVEDSERLSELGEVLGRGDRLRFLSRTMHREMMGELRWSADEVRRGDGLDVATLELSGADLAGLRVMSSWPAMELVGRLGGGRALEKPAAKAMAAASAAGLVSVAGRTREAYFAGGRAMQRVWLQATALGLAFQPMTPLTYLFARLELGDGEGLAPPEVATLRALRGRLASVFPEASGRGEPMLFRLAVAPPPAARALRRPLAEVLEIDPRASDSRAGPLRAGPSLHAPTRRRAG
ncbi:MULTISPECIES: Rv1355c family protein [unclassified Anaeromyxobacter]|uniref:Rv1355c family protein n=1 Tax=unclassified Anaeromyxobacter TaxID=2620896 RepID=UPI001F57E959|nr:MULTISPECIES: Rv1355c family protein [unclassified Anaeromyxobacter]